MAAPSLVTDRMTERLDLTGIDMEAFRRDPLDESTLRCLRYMHDVEHHTICYLRDVLVTSSHQDPDLTAFMTMWVYQEHWHGDALGQILEAHDEDPVVRRVETRRDLGLRDRLLPLGTMLADALTAHVPAVHMTWGAVNEWTAQAAYSRLAARSGHPVLREVLARIARQEGGHIAFYSRQARARLAASPTARRLTRFTLRQFWSPVGAGLMPEEEVAHLARHLFSGPEGLDAVDRVDRRVDGLPGLGGLDLMAGSARRLLRRG